MTKADLVAKIAANGKMTKAGAERSLNAFLDALQDVLVKDGKIAITGFGTFAVETRKARKGRNPRTSAVINIPAANVVKFRPGKHLKDAVN